MKNKQQSLFQQIISTSVRKVRENILSPQKDQFENSMKLIPTKIKQLDADPYLFIFTTLINFTHQIDFVLIQYQTMICQSFLNPDKCSTILVQHFKNHINHHSFRIIQILMEIKNPNLQFFTLFFQIHNSIINYHVDIAMPQNVLYGFKQTGYKWLKRAFCFKQRAIPKYIGELASGLVKIEFQDLPTQQDVNSSIQSYVSKIMSQIVTKIQNTLKPDNQKVQSKYGFCFMCYKPADFYCKDTGVAVCSSECKKKHISFIAKNPVLGFQYDEQFRSDIQKLLFANLRAKKNFGLSIQYLCAIYMNSDYIPKEPLPHKDLLSSVVIVERIWILYSMYYLRRNQVFEHIFADCLKNKNQYISISLTKYFIKIVECPKVCQFYQFLDCRGFKRILPIIINNLTDNQYKLKFVSSLIDRVYEAYSSVPLNKMVGSLQDDVAKQSTLLRALNYENNPINSFREAFGEKKCLREMVKFIIKNQESVNRTKVCHLVLSDDNLCLTFMDQLFIEKQQMSSNENPSKDPQSQNQAQQTSTSITLKFSPFIDEILRQLLYFINIKVSDKIYHLLQLLCQVLDIKRLKPSKQQNWHPYEPQLVFSPQNTSSQNTMFQFAYFIIMVITELNQTEGNYNSSGSLQTSKSPDKKKITETQFFNRVQNFDTKFANNMKQYIKGVYLRITDFSFSQQCRGILCKYQTVKKQVSPSNLQTQFHPIRMLLDNWQTIYECLANSNRDTKLLYRCCSCLVKFPTLCQPFFQLLLCKLTEQSNQSSQLLTVSTANIEKQQHLLPCINNIIQQEPNCIGVSSWKYLFLRNPNPSSSSNIYLFEISLLIHYSKSLTLSNFICFVREFCQNIKISQNSTQCLKLLGYNFSIFSSNISTHNFSIQSMKEEKQKMQILNKEFVQLFINQKNIYYQTQFIKGVFQVGDYQLGISLLDVVQVNIVSQALIICALIEIVEAHWELIENYEEKNVKNKKTLESQENKSANNSIKSNVQGSEQQLLLSSPNKIWTHILNKVLTIGIHSVNLFQQFCSSLRSHPSLQPYFQCLSIQHAIGSAFEGRQCFLDSAITTNLQKFQKHISQMRSTKCSKKQGVTTDNISENKGLLEQFVHVKNIKCIVKHFKYFWDIQAVYNVMVALVIDNIKSKSINESNSSKGQQGKSQNIQSLHDQQYIITTKDFSQILNILQSSNYQSIINFQNRLQSTISYMAVTVISLQHDLTLPIDIKQKQSIQTVLDGYKKELNVLLNDILIKKIKMYIQSSKMENLGEIINGSQSQQLKTKQQISWEEDAKEYQMFVCVNNLLYQYLQWLFNLLMNSQRDNINCIMKKLTKVFRIQQISQLIHTINMNFEQRNRLFATYHRINQAERQKRNNGSNSINGYRLPPGLTQQGYIADILSIMFSSSEKKSQNDCNYILCNGQALLQYLHMNFSTFKTLLALLSQRRQKHQQNKQNKHIKKKATNSVTSSTKTETTEKSSTDVQSSHSIDSTNSNVRSNQRINMDSKTEAKNNNNNNNADSQYKFQFQLYSQRIKYVQKLLSFVNKQLFCKHKHLNVNLKIGESNTVTELNKILVQYLQLGFDFYDPQTQSFQFDFANKEKKNDEQQSGHYIYNIYVAINTNNEKKDNINNVIVERH